VSPGEAGSAGRVCSWAGVCVRCGLGSGSCAAAAAGRRSPVRAAASGESPGGDLGSSPIVQLEVLPPLLLVCRASCSLQLLRMHPCQ
jgi:hypothetical protein